jgi:hypothetical protein
VLRGVAGGLVLVGIRAIGDLGIRLELLPPSGNQLRFVLGLRIWFAVWLGVPSSSQFGCCFPGCVPGDVGVGGPLLVAGVVGFEALAFGGQLRGEGCGGGRAGVVVPGAGVGALPVGVGFGLRCEPELRADVGRGGGAGALTLDGACFEFAAVQAADDVGFVADLQGGEDGFAHGFEFGVASVRLEGGGLAGVGDPGSFAVGGGDAGSAGVFGAECGGYAGGEDAELAG